MPIVPVQSDQYPESSVVSMAAYARHVQACECAFWGVNYDECTRTGGCNQIWTRDERDWVQHYLAEAQYELEQFVNYKFGRQWITDEQHDYRLPLATEYGYVIAGGVRTTATIAAGAAVDHTSDPAVIGPVATTVTDVSEIHVYHTDTDLEIMPSNITLSGGNVTLEIPRCRLVKPAYRDNPSQGLDYDDDTYFADTVDLTRVYNINDEPATLIKYCRGENCTDTRDTACVYVHNSMVGVLGLGCSSLCGDRVLLNYYAGRDLYNDDGTFRPWGRQAFNAIVRLAHAKMPHEPCACDAASEMWKRDRRVEVDGFGKPLRGISPFGPEEGAWVAYEFATNMKLYRAGVL
jgi:hypothetical protein